MLRRIFILGSFLLSLWSLQAQEHPEDSDSTSGMGTAFQYVQDFVVLSYANYTGEMDAQISTVFSDNLEKYRKEKILSQLLSGIDHQIPQGKLDSLSSAFFRKTGIRLYFTGYFEESDAPRLGYLKYFNNIMRKKTEVLPQHYIIVTTHLFKDETSYDVALSVSASEGIDLSRYHLNRAHEKNPFWGVTASNVETRGQMGRTIKSGLISGTEELIEKVRYNFLPDVLIAHEDDMIWYQNGETIEVPRIEGYQETLRVITKEGEAPTREVIWSISPDDAQTQAAITEGNELMFPVGSAGTYIINGKVGRDEVTVRLRVVGGQVTLRGLIREVLLQLLTPRQDEARDSLTLLGADSIQQRRISTTALEDLEAYNYPIEAGSNTLTSVLDQPRVFSEAEEAEFNRDNLRKVTLESLREEKRIHFDKQKARNLVLYIDKVLENNRDMGSLIDEVINNSGTLLEPLFRSALQGNFREEAKPIIGDFLTNNLSRIAGGDINLQLSDFQPLSITRGDALPSSYDPTKNFYINPKLPLKALEKEALQNEIITYQNSFDDPPFVVVNYSQDVDKESFLTRLPRGKPVGLEEGKPYKVINIVNYPGSILEEQFEYTASEESEVYPNGLAAQIKARSEVLSASLDASVFTIYHCQSCGSDEENSQNLTLSFDTPIPAGDLGLSGDYLNLQNGESTSTLIQVQRVSSGAGTCLLLYYSGDAANSLSDDLQSPISSGEGQSIPDLLVLYDHTHDRLYDCGEQLGEWGEAICDQPDAESIVTTTYLNSLFERLNNCILSTEVDNGVFNTLQSLQSQARSNIHVELEQDGVVYALDAEGNIKEVADPLTTEKINQGEFGTLNNEVIARVSFESGNLQYTALGINKDLTIGNSKTADLQAIAENIRTKSNSYFSDNEVNTPSRTPAEANATVDGLTTFPGGRRVDIDENSSFWKISGEGIGVTVSLLKTTEIEHGVYDNTDQTIKVPSIATGTVEGAAKSVTDITSTVTLVYDLVVDESIRQQTIDGFVAIKDQVVDDPTQLFPILGEVILEESTGLTTDNIAEIDQNGPNHYRSRHLVSKGTMVGAATAFFAGKLLTELPGICRKIAVKMVRAQLKLKLKGIGGIADDAIEALLKKIDNLGDDAAQFFDDFRDSFNDPELWKKFAGNNSLVDSWKVLENSARRTDINTLKFFDDPTVLASRQKILNDKIHEAFPNIPVEELTAIQHYTTNAHGNLNKALRGDIPMTDEYRAFEELMNSGMDKLPKYNGDKVFRGVKGDEAVLAKTWKEGDDISFGDFKSTSTKASVANEFAGDVVYEISNPKGRNICGVSCLPGESEVLFKSGSNFKVKEIKTDFVVYDDDFNPFTVRKVILEFVE